MAQTKVARAPWHLWAVGIVSLLWNSVGAFDYVMTQTRNEAYMGSFSEEQLAYFYGFPVWAVAAWAVAVWFSVAGSLLLLLRSKWAFQAFALSIVGMVTSFGYQFASGGGEVMGAGGFAFTIVIFVIAVFLLWYARAMRARIVLS